MKKMFKKDKVLKLYKEVAKECESACEREGYEFIQKYKKRLEKEVKDKITYLELKAICQKKLAEERSLPIALSALLVGMVGIFRDIFFGGKIGIIIMFLLCWGAPVYFVGKALFFIGKQDKYITTSLILEEIYKEKFETKERENTKNEENEEICKNKTLHGVECGDAVYGHGGAGICGGVFIAGGSSGRRKNGRTQNSEDRSGRNKCRTK